jgi:hypothetical protein
MEERKEAGRGRDRRGGGLGRLVQKQLTAHS